MKVIVVGAGMAGLAAARLLHHNNVAVSVLEARDRIGGRVWTRRDTSWPLPVELGPEFVHGNPPEFLAMLSAAHLRTVSVPDRHWLVRDGKVCDDTPWEGAMERLHCAPATDTSTAEHIASLPAAEHAIALSYTEGFYAARADDVSARWMAAQEIGGSAIHQELAHHVEGGLGQIPDYLMRQLPEHAVRLDHVVTAIDTTQGVRVRCHSKQGAAHPDVDGTHVIVTAPPPVAQRISFTPPLPADLDSALSGLRMGPVLKVSLRFSHPFWQTPGFMGQSEPAGMLHAPDLAWPTFWTSSPHESSVLVGWAAGSRAERLLAGDVDLANPESVSHAALRALGRATGIAAHTLEAWLEGCLYHDWQHDPFSAGAYAYARVGHASSPTRLLAGAGLVYFAGEATSVEHSGTIHGAYESGERAAQAVLAAAQRS